MPDRPRASVILATSNGTGLGHLARQAAIALALGDRGDPVIFSMSQALPLILDLGLRGEYCPSRHLDLLPPARWQHYLADRVSALVEETGAGVFAFDGVWPYAGIAFARRALPRVAFVWVRRPMWQPNANLDALDARHRFDLVLEPGDLASAADRGATARLDDVVRVPPVTLLEQVDRLPKEEAALRLGLDPARPTALVTLRGNDPDGAAAAAVRAVLARPEWQVALTRSPLSGPDSGSGDKRVVHLRGVFPLASYLAAFDAAVIEAGYNSFHEVLHAGLPALLVPTQAAVTDDQTARAQWAAEQGLALAAPDDDPQQIGEATTRLLAPDVGARLAERCAQLPSQRGASTAADVLLELSTNFRQHRFPAQERKQMRRKSLRMLKSRAVRLVKGTGISRGRASGSNPPQEAAPTVSMVAFADTITMAELGQNPPPEHLLHGASDQYRTVRERIADTYLGPTDTT